MTTNRHLLLVLAAALTFWFGVRPCPAANTPPCGKTYGDPLRDVVQSVKQTPDGGFIAAGFTDVPGMGKGALKVLRLDPAGAILWEKTFADTDWDGAADILPTDDGGLLIVGMTGTYEKNYRGLIHPPQSPAWNEDYPGDLWILRLNADGKQVWARSFGKAGDNVSAEIRKDPDGGYSVAAVSAYNTDRSSDVWLLKIPPGDDWARTSAVAGHYPRPMYSISLTSGGGFITAGLAQGQDPGDIQIFRFDDKGVQLWTKIFGGAKIDIPARIRQTSDGGYIIAAASNSFGKTGFDTWIIKTNASGDKTWVVLIGDIGDDRPYDIAETPDAMFLVSGTTYSSESGYSDIFLTLLDSSGKKTWSKKFGGGLTERATSLLAMNNNNYMVSCTTTSFGNGWFDFWLFTVSSVGKCVQ